MIPSFFLPDVISVSRRTSTGLDSLNNPTYGTSVSGTGWATIYTGVKCRLALSGKDVEFSPIGERIKPSGVLYTNAKYDIRNEDRIITSDNIQYVIIGVSTARLGSVVDHYEYTIQLP